jgi:hypothetical protein
MNKASKVRAICLCISIAMMILPSVAFAQQRGITGLWAEATGRDWCSEYSSGKLDGLPMSVVTNSGLVKISTNALEWVYSAASCSIKKLSGGPVRYFANASCEFKGTEYELEITFTVSGSHQMTMGFSNNNFPFAATSKYKRCSE